MLHWTTFALLQCTVSKHATRCFAALFIYNSVSHVALSCFSLQNNMCKESFCKKNPGRMITDMFDSFLACIGQMVSSESLFRIGGGIVLCLG